MAVRHELNLRAKDLIPTAVAKQVIDFAKIFRNTHLPKAWLEEEGARKPPFPSDTKWNSACRLLEWYVEERPKMKKVIEKQHVYFDTGATCLNVRRIGSNTRRSSINCRHSRNFERFDRLFLKSRVAKLRMA